MISALSQSSIHALCSGQVITNIEDAVQQLLENSLDAKADRVSLTLVSHGLDTLTIEDNGHGIRVSDCQILGQSRGTSSKRKDELVDQEPESLLWTSSYGWRGEALHALIQLSESATLVTRLPGAELATRVQWQRGERVSMSTTSLRSSPGTTVSFHQLFHHLPVRQASLKANGRKELSNIVALLQCFCAVHPTLSLQLHGQNECLLTIQGESELKQATSSCSKTHPLSLARLRRIYNQLAPVDLYPLSVEFPGEGRWFGYFSDPYSPLSTTKRASREWIWIVAQRPVRRLVFAEKALLRALESLGLEAGCVAWMMLCFETETGTEPAAPLASMPLEHATLQASSLSIPSSLDMNLTPDKRSIYMRREEEWSVHLQAAFYDALTRLPTRKKEMSQSVPRSLPSMLSMPIQRTLVSEPSCRVPHSSSSPLLSSSPMMATTTTTTALSTLSPLVAGHLLPEPSSDMMLSESQPLSQPSFPLPPFYAPSSSFSPLHSDHYFEKSDFDRLSIIGQYNAGFIITLLHETERDSLWIIDQHAADEKARYEALLKGYRESIGLLRIKMLHPVELKDLDQATRLALKDEHVLAQMSSLGFEFRVESQQGERGESERILWTCRPSSLVPGNDQEPLAVQVPDCLEILQAVRSMVGVDGSKPFPRPLIGRAQAVLASKACRSAVMIGTALSRVQMTAIVRKLATLEAPWTCPHGRPTLQFLYHL